MHHQEYKDFIEDLATNEVELNLSETQLERFAKRSTELETEYDFSLDDIKEEITALILPRLQDDDDWQYFVEELSNQIFDEMEANGGDSDEYSEDEEE